MAYGASPDASRYGHPQAAELLLLVQTLQAGMAPPYGQGRSSDLG